MAGKYRQTLASRRCLDRVFYGLMHRYDEHGARARLHDFTRLRSSLHFHYLDFIS